jgi:hypothetical protein
MRFKKASMKFAVTAFMVHNEKSSINHLDLFLECLKY